MMAGAFVVGSYFTLSQVLIPMIRALTETTTEMPVDVAFNRGVADILAGYEDGGGLTWALESEVKLATNSGWWDVDYQYKTPVTLKNLSTTTLATASAQITVNTQELVTANKLLNTCADLEVVYASESGEFVRLPRSTIISSGATTCADSPATTVTFPLPSTLQSASSSAGLALYYGNDQATIPNTSEGYNILRSDGSSVSATLVCPFNGTTTCLNQNGTVEPTTATGAIRYSGGSALGFDGKDDGVIGGAIQSSSVATIEAWVYLKGYDSNGSYRTIVASGGDNFALRMYGNYAGNDIVELLSYNGGYANVTSQGLSLNTWYHIAGVADGNQVKLYVNGALAGTPASKTNTVLMGSWNVGSAVGRYFNGLIDEVRISNTARYTENFTPQTTPFEPDEYTKLLLHFDENGDDPRNAGKAIDSSGNGNHGTITGAKYVSGLVGVDNSASQTGAIPASTYASHQGVFIEEGTTNLITNPSFENATSATLNWGTNYLNYATASATFTPSMAKRNSAGPFAAGPMVQGRSDASYAWNNGDSISWSQSNIAGSLTSTIDRSQGSIVFWITPEWNGNDGKTHYIFGQATDFALFKHSDNRLVLYDYGWSYLFDISDWTAGSTYNIVIRWDQKEKIGNSNYNFIITVNDVEKFTRTTSYVVGGGFYRLDPMDSIIEGLTIYRRPLYDGQYGIDVGNGDEIAQIYNSGTGKDPTLVTGSWDVVFALPTNASTGALTTGTGNAWSHPHASNLLYTSTTNTGGFMMNGTASNDGWTAIDGEWWNANGASGVTAAYQSIGASSLATSYINKASPGTNDANVGIAPTWDTSSGWIFNGSSQYLTTGIIPSTATTAIVRFSSAGTGQILATTDSSTWNRFVLLAINTPNGWGPFYASGNQAWGGYSGVTSGVLAIAGRKGYFNGTEQVTLADYTTSATQGINIGRGGTGTVSPQYYAGNVQAVAIYNETLTQEQVQGVTTAMSALGGNIFSLSSSEKIFSGGYKVNSSVVNQGISRSFTATNGGDYVLRALGHSDGTCSPQVKITRADGTTEISHLNGTTTSTRTDPDVYIFTWESPAAEANQVQLINTASSGTCFWHQVEVLANLIDNPSFDRSWSGADPNVPSGWINTGAGAGEMQAGTDVYSGGNSLYFSGADNLEGVTQFNKFSQVGKYYSVGGYGKKSSGTMYIAAYNNEPNLKHQSSNSTYYLPVTSSSWSHISGVARVNGAIWNNAFAVQSWSPNSTGYYDDVYTFVLPDVSLTVTPANQTNSTETTGLRVDGADRLTQPVTGLSADRGVIKFKFTPRHSFDTASSFGQLYPFIVKLVGDGSNYIQLYKSGNNLSINGTFNGTAVTGNWASPTLNADTTYSFEISYQTAGSLKLIVDGVDRIISSGVVAFSVVPTTSWYGSDNAASAQYDGTISNFIALTPTENTTAPYYKFGSKSVRLVNAGTMPDEYTIAIDPNSTATHTLSAYVYDGTTGNVGGTVASSSAKLVFGGNVVTPSAYTDMGGGWWRLTYSAATTDASLLYGVQAQAGKTIYVDGVQLEAKTYATTYADGSLGTGYSWSGVANESGGVRASGDLTFASANNLSETNGSADFWVLTSGQNPATYRVLFSADAGDGWTNFIKLYTTGTTLRGVRNAGSCCSNLVDFGSTTLSNSQWNHIVISWDSAVGISVFRNGTLAFSNSNTNGWPSTLPYIKISKGFWQSNGNYANSTISDLRIFNQALTPSEVSALYQQGLVTHSSDAEAVDRYSASGTYTSPVIDLGANGAWGSVPWSVSNVLNGGGINYFTRTSMDNSVWSEWQAVTGSVGEGSWTGSIASDPRRYLQWKADLTSNGDQSQSPVISSMSTTYVEDSTPPANPAQVALGYANHASSSATLTSNEWYNYATPKFTWETGVDDPAQGQSSSGIDGYHVLLTTDESATPSANLASPCYRFSESDDRIFSVGTTPDTCTLSDADYYLRIQTKDNSGNVSDPVTLFTYRYDSTPPRSPVSVSSTTVGYTSQNEFSFYWPPASDQGLNQSGLAYYEYKTGATEGTFSDWTKSNEAGQPLVTTASNVTAYQEGQNFFFVRTVDFAGNVSAEISNLGVSPFYYNESAPTAPENVVITPETSSESPAAENIFTVTWDKPASYSGELAKYYYCVNCTPSAETMTETTNAQTADRTLTNIALATQQGKNTFYLVAEDNNINTDTGRGNVNFEAYATAEFYASTIAPGAPTNLTISDASDRDAEVWRLTLAWKQAVTGGTPNFYAIHRSTDGTTFTKIGETTSTAYTDADLTQSQEYSYKVFAIDNANSTSLSSNIVTLAPEGKYTTPPLAGGTPNVAVGSTVATITWSTGRIAYGAVEYGKTTSYESSVAETVAVGNHSIKLTGLTPGTVYHYRVQALDDSILMGYDRENAYSADYTFTTSALPTISNVEVTDLTLASAIINWSAVSLSSATIEYGESTAYGASVSVGVGSSGTYSTKLSGLKDSVTYHFRIRAVDIDGTDITSDDYTFTTLTFPKVTAVVFKTDQAQNATAINVAWSTNVPTTASVEYQAVKIDPSFASQSEINYSNSSVLQGLSQTELARLPVVPLGSPQYLDRSTISNRHVVQITNLSDSSLYVFTIRGRDEYGNQAVSDPIRYVTGADTKPPSVENLVIETPIVGEGVESKAEIVLSFTTDEPAFSQVLWGAGTGSEYPQATQTSSEATTDHMIVLRDLDPTSTYHLKIKTTDQTGNTSETEDTVVVTPTAQAAAFELILKNLEGIFGFLGLQ